MFIVLVGMDVFGRIQCLSIWTREGHISGEDIFLPEQRFSFRFPLPSQQSKREGNRSFPELINPEEGKDDSPQGIPHPITWPLAVFLARLQNVWFNSLAFPWTIFKCTVKEGVALTRDSICAANFRWSYYRFEQILLIWCKTFHKNRIKT